nr:TonB-dependent receptor [Sphingomonas sp. CDS-1]
MRKQVRRYLLNGVMMGCIFGTPALAQEVDAPSTPQSQQTSGLSDIIVTAQRRSQSMMAVPLAIQAVDSTLLQKQGISRIEELQNSVTGLTMQYGSNGYLTPFLRGIGNQVAGNYAENSVAIYIDDVPRPRSSSSTELVNLERVEVLKGPQGALYGRNATGGAINIVTKEPNDERSLMGRITYGNFHTLEAQLFANVPLAEGIAFNAAVSHRERDGLIKATAPYASNPLRPTPGDPRQLNFAPGFDFPAKGPRGRHDYEDKNSDSIDAKLRIDLGDVKIVLRGDYTNIADSNTTGWINTRPEVIAATLSAITGFAIAPGEIVTGRPGRTSTQDQQGFKWLRDWGTSAKIEADLSGVTVTSITAYRENQQVGSTEIDATPIPLAGFSADFDSRIFSQELRAVSNGDGPLQWIVGGTYFTDTTKDRISGEVGSILLPGGAAGLTREQVLAGEFPRITLPILYSTLKAKAFAVFGQLSYELGDAFEIIASGRYAEEKRTLVFPGQILTGGTEFDGTRKEHAFTPAVTLNYKVPGSGIIYARWAKGFKSGGLNNLLNPTASVNGGPVGINQFKPEKLTSYELGYKAELFDRRLRVVASAYYYDYANLQVARTLSAEATSFVLNADKARVKGAELELTGRLAEGVTLSANGAYTDGKYKDFVVADAVNFDASGNRMLNAPKWQFGSTLDVTRPVGNNLDFTGSATVSYRSAFFFDPENSSFLRQGGYAIVNGRIGLQTQDQKYGAYLYVKNLFDKVYYGFGQQSQFGSFVSFGERRLWGGTVEMRF